MGTWKVSIFPWAIFFNSLHLVTGIYKQYEFNISCKVHYLMFISVHVRYFVCIFLLKDKSVKFYMSNTHFNSGDRGSSEGKLANKKT